MSSYQVTTIDLLRHGACEGGEIFRGSTDVALCDEGWQQMDAALSGQSGWQHIFSSSLRRCRGFAERFAAAQELPLHVRDDLQELHFGDWEGQLLTDVEREHGETLQSFWRDPSRVTPPGGEPMADFRDRVKSAMDDILAAHRGEQLLIITHGAVIRLLLCEWLRMPMTAFSNIAVPYAGFSRVRVVHWGEREPWVQLCLHRGE
jgi:broad specificity phosphatase PhoE